VAPCYCLTVRLLVASFAVFVLHLDPCGGGTTTTGNGTGTNPAGGGGATTPACTIFYDGWNYDTATLYQAGMDPIVGSVSGTADFKADGTYVQSYFIGKVGNDFAGDYTLDGERLKTNDKDGKPVFDFKYTCGDTTKEMVLTLQKPDGSPDIVYGLHARAKM
jgi:hypothetical protein